MPKQVYQNNVTIVDDREICDKNQPSAQEKKRIFHGVIVRIGKVEPEGWPVRSGPSFSEVQITGLPEGSTFPILTNDPVMDYYSCLSTFNWSFVTVTQRFLHVYLEWR